jgi:hypothetical protein
MIDVSGLEAAVAAQVTTVDGVVTLLNSLRDSIVADLAGDATAQAVVNAAVDSLVADGSKLAAAMESNVPVP